MKIRMLEHRSGPRYDGRTWPVVGEDFDVPDDEGAGLCRQGSATPVAADPESTVEKRDGAEDAEKPRARQRPAQSRTQASKG